jgi:hypothetical protein
MFSLYFSREAGRVTELFTTCVTGEESMAKKKTRKVRAAAKARFQSNCSEESEGD